MFMERCDGRL